MAAKLVDVTGCKQEYDVWLGKEVPEKACNTFSWRRQESEIKKM
jgi:hypothetical protein